MKAARMMKEILRDSAILTGLIIVPIAFLGPGWRPKNPDAISSTERFSQEHGRTSNSKESEPASDNGYGDRENTILHAFPKHNWDDDQYEK